MAGHSHWANIARKKALVDTKRGKLWSKLSKAIIVAAKSGGGDIDMNLKLRYAIDAAKADPKIAKLLEGKTIRREIYVPGRLVNLVAT